MGSQTFAVIRVFLSAALLGSSHHNVNVSDTQSEHDIVLPILNGAVDRFFFDVCKVVTLNANHEKPKIQNAKCLAHDTTHFNSQCLSFMLLNFWRLPT